jgi:hypothetical protein
MKTKPKSKRKEEQTREIARLYTVMRLIPLPILSRLTSTQLITAYNLNLHYHTIATHRRRFVREFFQEGDMNPDGEQEVSAQAALEEIAKTYTKTYSYCGQNESIASESALDVIGRELRHFDPAILNRNAKKQPKERKPLLEQRPSSANSN